MIDDERLKRIKKSAQEQLFRIPGVHSVAIGPKYSQGQAAGEIGIIVSVLKKRPLSQIPPSEMIPAEIEGIKTDVVERPVSHLTAAVLNDGERRRPIRGGTQIQLKWVSRQDIFETISTETGTLGFIGHTTGTIPGIAAGQIVGVTCAHVVANPEFGSPLADAIGHKVGQSKPTECSKCSGCCNHIIGTVLRLVDTAPDSSNVDAAIVGLTPDLEYFADIYEVGAVKGFHAIQPSDLSPNPPHYRVKKRGRTTGLTTGDVTSVNGTSVIDGTTFTDDEIRIQPDPSTPVWDVCGPFNNLRAFDCQGDSGSALLNTNNEVVGVVCKNNASGEGIATGIDIVKKALGIEVDTATSANQKRKVPAVAGAHAMAVELPLPLAAFIPPEQQSALDRAQQEILATVSGRRYAQIVMRHQEEVRHLIDTNRRVATVWHRSGGPAILQSALEAIEQPRQSLPRQIDGQPLQQCLGRIVDILTKYGSVALGSDISCYGPQLAGFAGLSYAEVLMLLSAQGTRSR